MDIVSNAGVIHHWVIWEDNHKWPADKAASYSSHHPSTHLQKPRKMTKDLSHDSQWSGQDSNHVSNAHKYRPLTLYQRLIAVSQRHR